MDHLEPSYIGIERSLMIQAKTLERLTKELKAAKKKLADPKLPADKKTFLKAQLPKLEKQTKETKVKVVDLLDSSEIDPKGEFFILGTKLVK